MTDDPLDQVRQRFADAEDIGGDDERPPPDSDDAAAEKRRQAAQFPLHDLGNAQRLVTYFGDDLLFVPRVGWFTWSGRVWRKDPDRLGVRSLAQKLSALIVAEVPAVELEDWQSELLASIPGLEQRVKELSVIDKEYRTEDQREDLRQVQERLNIAYKQKTALGSKRSEHRKFAKSTGNGDKIKRAIEESQVKLASPLEALDADALAVNVGNGILRFNVESGEGFSAVADVRVDSHERSALQTKIIDAIYDSDATSPAFDAFLERIQPDQDMREFLQRWFGLSLTGLTGDQKLAFLYGHGANGKSVLVDLIAGILGDYSATAKIESLTGQTKRGGADATPDLIPLIGARMVRASEPEQGEKLKEGTIKELTGGEPILVRALHSDFVEVKPEFKLTISGNYKPAIRGTDDGIWRRVLLIPFDVQIPQAERDPDLGKKLQAEASGILRWMVDGLLAYLEGGLQEPLKVIEATSEYRAESDPVGTFLTDCTVVTGASADFLESRDLIDAFNFWIERRDGSQWGGRTVSLRLKDKADKWRHPASGKTFSAARRATSGYRGLQLTDVFKAEMRDKGGSSGSSGSQDGGRAGYDDEVPL